MYHDPRPMYHDPRPMYRDTAVQKEPNPLKMGVFTESRAGGHRFTLGNRFVLGLGEVGEGVKFPFDAAMDAV